VLPLEAPARMAGAQDLDPSLCRIHFRMFHYRLRSHQADPDPLDQPYVPAPQALNAARYLPAIHVFIRTIT
jgi:hypothetical protein